MKRDSWIVNEEASRGRQLGDRCFYCPAAIGSEHAPGCVCRKRTVVVATTVTHVITVPEDWTPDDIRFWRNNSSSCGSNAMQDIVSLVERREAHECADEECVTHPNCGCDMQETDFIREATADDEMNSLKSIDAEVAP